MATQRTITKNMRFLRHKKKGTIYNYNERTAKNNSNLEEVTGLEAFPERFAPKSVKGKKPKVNLETKTVPDEEKYPGMVELEADASRGLKKKAGVKT